uniref:Uncharacterized protein n=1 Tax=Aplanochytrium stocchinoi TaxID=215587 RepID=A0A7S3PQ06_9STRA|mmetsp:Transcript_8948/g.11237  ORF Transcript_8948/g.11237 Transcript_8948/m.11237 type:complete len:324 (+) Transcript_8948:273-1244(+)|eukprot:CAMPEP_0204843726 /NCGR_PEP_ID=MMETSP1346-20131115/48147_1 /ASSEMBLY_ACC=CAM_ASM_000771 /TAXON_ID=215587 /ORGANISM="Aplanochytrium stocchinoi, Strain GSBS06" /LENGTH=323 /DNA_ID=CAMNT_0051982915 /DNA_START=665 /DNA_END=1636 /DNA_ORIENTATION=-
MDHIIFANEAVEAYAEALSKVLKDYEECFKFVQAPLIRQKEREKEKERRKANDIDVVLALARRVRQVNNNDNNNSDKKNDMEKHLRRKRNSAPLSSFIDKDDEKEREEEDLKFSRPYLMNRQKLLVQEKATRRARASFLSVARDCLCVEDYNDSEKGFQKETLHLYEDILVKELIGVCEKFKFEQPKIEQVFPLWYHIKMIRQEGERISYERARLKSQRDSCTIQDVLQEWLFRMTSAANDTWTNVLKKRTGRHKNLSEIHEQMRQRLFHNVLEGCFMPVTLEKLKSDKNLKLYRTFHALTHPSQYNQRGSIISNSVFPSMND